MLQSFDHHNYTKHQSFAVVTNSFRLWWGNIHIIREEGEKKEPAPITIRPQVERGETQMTHGCIQYAWLAEMSGNKVNPPPMANVKLKKQHVHDYF